MAIRFVSSNLNKIAESTEILGRRGISIVPVEMKIEELQTTDTKRLVDDKLLHAFERIGRPLFVEHTGLYVQEASGLPGGLTQIFWDALKADAFARVFGSVSNPTRAIARTSIALCDGKRIIYFEGEIAGQLLSTPRGPRDFQWDCVFQPDGATESFAEMGNKKNEVSMRRTALDKLADYLKLHGF